MQDNLVIICDYEKRLIKYLKKLDKPYNRKIMIILGEVYIFFVLVFISIEFKLNNDFPHICKKLEISIKILVFLHWQRIFSFISMCKK